MDAFVNTFTSNFSPKAQAAPISLHANGFATRPNSSASTQLSNNRPALQHDVVQPPPLYGGPQAFRASSSSFQRQANSTDGWRAPRLPEGRVNAGFNTPQGPQQLSLPSALGKSQSEASLFPAGGERSFPDCSLSSSSSAGKLPSLDQRNNTAIGKHFGAARDRLGGTLRNIWGCGKARPGASGNYGYSVRPTSNEQQKRGCIEENEEMHYRAPEMLQPGAHLEAIAQKVFRLHAKGADELLAFCKLPAALQSLHAECQDFELSDDIVQQLPKLGSFQNTDLRFEDFLALFKQGLQGRDCQAPSSGKFAARLPSSPGLPSITFDGQRQTGGGAARPNPLGAPSDSPDRRASKRASLSLLGTANQPAVKAFKQRSPLKRKMRKAVVKLMKDPDLEGIAIKIFQVLDPRSNGGRLNLVELKSALKTFNLGFAEATFCEIADNWDHAWEFGDFLELFKDELRKAALESNGDQCPLSFSEFFALAR